MTLCFEVGIEPTFFRLCSLMTYPFVYSFVFAVSITLFTGHFNILFLTVAKFLYFLFAVCVPNTHWLDSNQRPCYYRNIYLNNCCTSYKHNLMVFSLPTELQYVQQPLMVTLHLISGQSRIHYYYDKGLCLLFCKTGTAVNPNNRKAGF